MSKILIVEDDLSIQALLNDFIQEAGYSVVLASDGVEALAIQYCLYDQPLVMPSGTYRQSKHSCYHFFTASGQR